MILDASVLIASYDSGDRFFDQAIEIFRSGPHQAHAVNVAEAASILLRKHPHGSAIVDEVFRAQEFEISHAGVERSAAELHARRPTRKVSLADCFGAALALATGEPLATADADVLPYANTDGLKVHLLGR